MYSAADNLACSAIDSEIFREIVFVNIALPSCVCERESRACVGRGKIRNRWRVRGNKRLGWMLVDWKLFAVCTLRKLNNPTSKRKFLHELSVLCLSLVELLNFLSMLENFHAKSMKFRNSTKITFFLNGACLACCFINLRQAQEVGRFWEANIETAFQGAHRQAACKVFPLARTTEFTCWCLYPFLVSNRGHFGFERIGGKAQKKNRKKSATDKAVRAKKGKNFPPLPFSLFPLVLPPDIL